MLRQTALSTISGGGGSPPRASSWPKREIRKQTSSSRAQRRRRAHDKGTARPRIAALSPGRQLRPVIEKLRDREKRRGRGTATAWRARTNRGHKLAARHQRRSSKQAESSSWATEAAWKTPAAAANAINDIAAGKSPRLRDPAGRAEFGDRGHAWPPNPRRRKPPAKTGQMTNRPPPQATHRGRRARWPSASRALQSHASPRPPTKARVIFRALFATIGLF